MQVRVAFRAGSHPLLQVEVSAAGREKFYLVDPQGGSLTVRAAAPLRDREAEAGAVAEAVQEELERPMATMEGTAPMDTADQMARRAEPAASP